MSEAFAPDAEGGGSWIASTGEKLSQMLCSESLQGYRRSGLILLVAFVLLDAIFAIMGAAPITGPWDVVALLDGGWRIINGQVPHTDFHNPIGPLTYLLVAFGMKIGSPSTSSIAYGSVLLLALLLPWAWTIAAARLPWAIAFIFVLLAGFYLVTPRPPGYPIFDTTYAMIYNRQSYVLISMLILCVFLKSRGIARQSEWRDGLSVGVVLALLLYCKITYFVFATGLTLLGMVLDLRPLRFFLAAAGAFAGVCVAFSVILRINLYRYVLDIAAAGHSQSPRMRIKLLTQSLGTNAMWLYLLAFCLALLTWASVQGSRNRWWGLRAWMVAGAIIAAALLISSGNAAQGGGGDDPLYFIAVMVFLELFRRSNTEPLAKPGTAARLAYTASFVLILPIFWGTILARDMASCAYALAWDVERRPGFNPSHRLHSADLRDFYVPPSTAHITAYWPARNYAEKINDGIDLLQKYLQKGDRVTTIGFANPFSFALGLPPARDGYLWWDLNFSFDRRHFPPAKDFLGDASLVMVPRITDRKQGCCFDTVEALLELYKDYFQANFHELASTDTWVLYRRNPTPQGSPSAVSFVSTILRPL